MTFGTHPQTPDCRPVGILPHLCHGKKKISKPFSQFTLTSGNNYNIVTANKTLRKFESGEHSNFFCLLHDKHQSIVNTDLYFQYSASMFLSIFRWLKWPLLKCCLCIPWTTVSWFERKSPKCVQTNSTMNINTVLVCGILSTVCSLL